MVAAAGGKPSLLLARPKQRDNFFTADFGDDFFASNRENSRLGFRSALTRSYPIGSASLKSTYGFDFTAVHLPYGPGDPAIVQGQ
ncbi:MAG: hypothetical protein MEP44_08025 [Blastomonas sp.]|nr:hypothetical protein [Blastomonas sp.]